MPYLPKISDPGFQRIAQAVSARPGKSDFSGVHPDIEAIRGWIDYLSNMQVASEEEIEELTQRVDFLESHLYDVDGKPEMAKDLDVTPFYASPYVDLGMQDYEEYVKTLPYPPAGY